MSATSRKNCNEERDGPCCYYTYKHPIENTEDSPSENAPIEEQDRELDSSDRWNLYEVEWELQLDERLA